MKKSAQILILLAMVISFQLMESGALHARNESYKVKFDGRVRLFRVHVPKDYEGNRKLPMVIVLHGAASNSFTVGLASKMSKKADEDKFFVVYPAGIGLTSGSFRTWNAGECCGPAKWKKVDDVGFINALIEKMKSDYPVDSKMIYVAGMSNGGMMAYRLAAELGEKIAAIGVVEACMLCDKPEAEVPVSVVAFHSEKDKVVPIDGGVGRWFTLRTKFPPVRESIEYWVERNQCDSDPVITRFGGVTKFKYGEGVANTEVVFYRMDDGGHSWPGGFRIPIFFRPSKKISATDAMCRFFWTHPKATSKAAVSNSVSF